LSTNSQPKFNDFTLLRPAQMSRSERGKFDYITAFVNSEVFSLLKIYDILTLFSRLLLIYLNLVGFLLILWVGKAGIFAFFC